MSNRLRALWLPAAIALSLLTGCAAQMQPVADFGASANHLAAAYKPFTKDLEDRCEQQQRYAALIASGDYDDGIVRRKAVDICAQYKQAGATAAALGDGVAAYAVALVKLSGAKATVFDSDIGDVSTKLGTMTHDGSPLIAADDLSTATKVLRGVAQLVEEGKLQTLTRSTLRDNQAALEVVVGAMKRYADQVYDHQLTATKGTLDGAHATLVTASRAAPDATPVLPWRLAQPALRAEIEANTQAHDHVVAFDKAADALLKAHADLVDNFDTLTGVKRLKLVQEFIAKVQAIEADAAAL